jgi:hypothetical protein
VPVVLRHGIVLVGQVVGVEQRKSAPPVPSANLKSYVFFFEAIIQGQANKGGRCPDGTITVVRQGDNLALGWFGSVQSDMIVASGMLTKK